MISENNYTYLFLLSQLQAYSNYITFTFFSRVSIIKTSSHAMFQNYIRIRVLQFCKRHITNRTNALPVLLQVLSSPTDMIFSPITTSIDLYTSQQHKAILEVRQATQI